MNKAQVKMTETIGVMFVFFLLVVFGFVFYARIQASNYQNTLIEENEKRAVEVAQRASTLPELQCSSNNIVTDNCIDIQKLESMSNMLKSNQDLQISYYDSFESSRLIVKQIYPSKKEWLIYERIVNNTGFLFTPIPLSLYDPINNRYNFGILEVTYYPIK